MAGEVDASVTTKIRFIEGLHRSDSPMSSHFSKNMPDPLNNGIVCRPHPSFTIFTVDIHLILPNRILLIQADRRFYWVRSKRK